MINTHHHCHHHQSHHHHIFPANTTGQQTDHQSNPAVTSHHQHHNNTTDHLYCYVLPNTPSVPPSLTRDQGNEKYYYEITPDLTARRVAVIEPQEHALQNPASQDTPYLPYYENLAVSDASLSDLHTSPLRRLSLYATMPRGRRNPACKKNNSCV